MTVEPHRDNGSVSKIESTWDVVVIGAGPAGSSAALTAARSGMSVLLVDAKSFPRRKACGGCLNLVTVDLLEQLIGKQHSFWKQTTPLHEFRIHHRRSAFVIPVPAGGSAVDRAEMDDAIVGAAIDAGVQFEASAVATIGRLESGGRLVEIQSRVAEEDGDQADTPLRTIRTVLARSIVVATGLSGRSVIRDTRLVAVEKRRSRVGIEAVFQQCPDQFETGSLTMAIASAGYVGLTAIGQGRLHVASAVDRDVLKQFGPQRTLEEILRSAGTPEIGRPETRFQGTAALTTSASSVAADRVFLVGDAAGYVEPFTGEGIRWALESGIGVVPSLHIGSFQPVGNAEAHWRQWHRRQIVVGQRLCRSICTGIKSDAVRWFAHQAMRFRPSLAVNIVRRINGLSPPATRLPARRSYS